jgi:hypothetical protein
VFAATTPASVNDKPCSLEKISVLSLLLIQKSCHEVACIDPWVDIFEMQNADSFVDNTSNGCNGAHLDSAMPYRELIAYGPVCAQIWE